MRTAALALSFLAPLILCTESGAALLVHESFEGYSTGTLIGQAVHANATGISGSYSGSNFDYNPVGLSFGDYIVSGGSARSNTSQFTSLTASIAPGTSATGTLWMGYLFSNSSIGGNVRTNISNDLRTAPVLGGASNRAGVSYSEANYQTSSGSAVAANTTYFMIARWTNVGSALSPGSPGSALFWVLDEAQYESFALAGFTESYLVAADVGTGADEVFAKLGSPLYQTSGTYLFDDTKSLSLEVVNSFAAQTFDEIRIGTTLNDVLLTTAIPESRTVWLMLPAILTAMVWRRKALRA